MDKIEEILTRGVANIIPGKEELTKLLNSDKKLNIYLGIDPTSTRIHIGHAVPLRKIQAFLELGHHVTFLIGDFTALVGDTSDKDSERPILTEKEIEANFQTYKKQAEKIVDFSKVKVVRNSDWLKKLTFAEIIKLTQHFSINDFISRELIRKRLDEGKRVRLDEVLYPIMQGFDSYTMDTDIQIGGTDQTFNMQAGRTLNKNLRNKESFVLSVEFLMGTDGRKMSKSWGNAIWLEDEPNDMYGKVMAVNDNLLVEYFTLGTILPLKEVTEIANALKHGEHPMNIKKQLAYQIVSELYSKDEAHKAAENFEKTVQKDELPDHIDTIHVKDNNQSIVDILLTIGFAVSKSDARRLIEQGGVSVNNNRVSDVNTVFKDIASKENLIQVGKRRFMKVKVG